MTIKEHKEIYQKDKKQLLKLYSEGTNFKIHSAEFYESEGIFRILEENLDNYFKPDGMNYFSGMTIEKEILRSIVENPDETVLKFHDSITISLPDGSHIRFSPYKNDTIEITRVLVTHESRNNGIGSLLIETVFEFIGRTVGHLPKMFLECTGAVGMDPINASTVPIQTSFFRKHGFRVNNRKYYPRYVTMTRPKQNYINE
jgi:GNAT superfamily N-acetyltransferase